MKGELRKPASVNAILLIGIFTFVFLGAEYLFVNMISLSVTEGRTVIAQNYALGASAVGFFLYPAMERWGGRRYKSALTFILALGAIICTFIVQQHISYAATMTAGMVLFLLLAFSGLAAGIVFDIRKRKYMGLIMYCVMMMSVLSIVVLNLGAPFLIGLVVFYLSSGFFVVFFTASFMELSRHMRLPSLWAGMGRAMNNVSAALITNGSVALLATGNSLAAIVIALVLFVAVSVAMAAYTARMNAVMEPKEPPASQKSDEERREAFIAKYGLTEREWDVFSQMISSDSSAQEIADCLFLSKRTVERHISALYEKTGAKSRITMYQLYRND